MKIYDISIEFDFSKRQGDIYTYKEIKNVRGCLLWLCTLQFYFEMCSKRDFQYSLITHALLITVSIKSPLFTTTHIKKGKFWAGQGGSSETVISSA